MSPGDLDLIGWSMMWLGSAILFVCVMVDFASMPSPFGYFPDYSEPPWTPHSTIGEILSRLDNEEAADNESLTLHESLDSWCGPPLPYHHPTITTEGTITNG